MNTNTHEHPALQELTLLTHWEAHNEPLHDRGKTWYAVGGGIVLAGAVYGIVSGSWAFSIVCVLCAAMYVLLKDHVPATHSMALFEEGVMYDEHFIRWEDIEGFWTIDSAHYSILHVVMRTKNTADIAILMAPEDREHTRLLLAQYTPELDDRRESFLDFIYRFCKL